MTSLSKKARRLLVVSLLVTLVVITEIFGILINLAKPVSSAEGQALSLNVYYKFDCENSRYADITTFFFNEKGGMGKVLQRISDADEKWKDIAQQEALEKTRQAVCKR